MKLRRVNYETIEQVVVANGKGVLIIFVGKKTGSMDVQLSRLSLIEGHTEVEEALCGMGLSDIRIYLIPHDAL